MIEFWNKYDLLCDSLKKEGNIETQKELLEIKKYVTGLTDGWFDFLVGFEGIIENHKIKDKYRQIASELILDLRKMLNIKR
jgi:hypothetical protein